MDAETLNKLRSMTADELRRELDVAADNARILRALLAARLRRDRQERDEYESEARLQPA